MLEDRAALEAIVQRAYEAGRRALGSGAVANYIPELANASPGWFGVAVQPLGDEEAVIAGDADLAFSLQSVSKTFFAGETAQSIDQSKDGVWVEAEGVFIMGDASTIELAKRGSLEAARRQAAKRGRSASRARSGTHRVGVALTGGLTTRTDRRGRCRGIIARSGHLPRRPPQFGSGW